jgi:hypothetical protein
MAYYRHSVIEKRVFFDLGSGLQHPSTERLLQRRIIYVRKRRRRYSTGAGVLGAIMVTLIAGAFMLVAGGRNRESPVGGASRRHRVLLFASQPP